MISALYNFMRFCEQNHKIMKFLKHVAMYAPGFIIGLCVMAGLGEAAQVDRFIYSIQVASYQKQQLAVNAVEKLKKDALVAFYRSQEIKGKGVWYRIYIDTFASIGEAQKAAVRMQQQKKISDYYIRRLPEAEKSITTDDLSKKKDVRLTIQDIVYTSGKGRNDSLSIQGDRYFWPTVTCSLQGPKPTLLIYIDSLDSLQKDISNIMIEGTLITQLENRLNRDTNTLMLKVVLNDSANYTISQEFDKIENVFSIGLQADKSYQKTTRDKALALKQ